MEQVKNSTETTINWEELLSRSKEKLTAKEEETDYSAEIIDRMQRVLGEVLKKAA